MLEPALRRYELIAIGCSMGGMHALEVILCSLTPDFPVPIVAVQHRYRTSNDTLPAYFRRNCKLDVVDANDKQWVEPGKVYLAPADYHLMVSREDDRGELSLSVDAKVGYSRPSIDILFESAADAYRNALVAVILTGANDDGSRGAKRVKQRGGLVVVQDPLTAESPTMPQAAIAAVRVDRILPLERIGPFLIELCRHSQ